MACRQRRCDFDRFEKRRSSGLSTGTRRPGEGGVLPFRASAGRRGRFEEKFFFFHNRRRNVRRNVRAKSPLRAGNGDAIWTDLRNVGTRGYRPARVARARAGSCRRASAGRRGRFEEKIFFFHNRRRNVRRNVRAKSPWRAGNGDAIWTDLRNVGPRGYRPARVARARAGSCRRASAGRRGRFEEKFFFFHNRRRNVRRNVRAKSPWRAGNGDAIWTDLRNVGPRGYRPARVARARAGSCRRASAGRRGRFEEKIFFFEISRRGRLRPIAGAGACTKPQAAFSCRRLRRAGSLLRNPVPEKRQSPECDSHSEELPPPFRVGSCRHSRLRNVRRNVRAKFPARAGIGDAILTDVKI